MVEPMNIYRPTNWQHALGTTFVAADSSCLIQEGPKA